MRNRIWFDIYNSPHVLILIPIIKEMLARGYEPIVTARDYSQTLPMLQMTGIEYSVIGEHGGKTTIGKAAAFLSRTIGLYRFIRNQSKSICASICHGSRELIMVSKLLCIPSVTMFDYEYTEHFIKNRWASLMLVPDAIPDSRLFELNYHMNKIRKYPGLKESIYLGSSVFNSDIDSSAFCNNEKIVHVVFRPPSTASHYHDQDSITLLPELLKYLDREYVRILVLPRYSSQMPMLNSLFSSMKNKPIILTEAVDGPQLISKADFCITGGGTMAREAAVLGTPAYSIFSGNIGAVDEFLERTGKLSLIRKLSDITKIEIQKKVPITPEKRNGTMHAVCDIFCDFIHSESIT